jgi:hypothetical protein
LEEGYEVYKKRKLIYSLIFLSMVIEGGAFVASFRMRPFTSLGYFLGGILGFIISVFLFIICIIINKIIDRSALKRKK